MGYHYFWKLMDKEDIYVSFSGTITQFRKNNGQAVFAKFQHVGDSLFIHCYSITDVTGTPEDIDLIENVFGLKPFGNIRFRIDALDDDQLLLSKDNQHWKLIKW